jgi:hypothetical protein
MFQLQNGYGRADQGMFYISMDVEIRYHYDENTQLDSKFLKNQCHHKNLSKIVLRYSTPKM